MATIVETHHDDKGIIWPGEVAPLDAHLVEIRDAKAEIRKKAENIYKKLVTKGVDVLWDDRDVGAGEKFADADLIGIPVRLVISDQTKNKVEWKKRDSKKTELLTLEQVISKLRR